jgi:hypothetical protein
MAQEIYVTSAQADAAKMIVERNSAKGAATPASIRKIADVQVSPAAPVKPQGTAPSLKGTTRRGATRGRLRNMIERARKAK